MTSLIIVLVVCAFISYEIYGHYASRKALTDSMDHELDELTACLEELLNMQSGKQYIRKAIISDYLDKLEKINSLKLAMSHKVSVNHPASAILVQLKDFFNNTDNVRENINEKFIELEMHRYNVLFNKVEKHGLNIKQKRAVVVNEKNNLIVAGAGTGKTSTIIARVAYILSKSLATEDQILLLAFSKDAAEVMRDRIKERTGHQVEVKTFHALGLQIMGSVEGGKPPVFARDILQFTRILQGFIENISSDPKMLNLMVNYFLYYMQTFKDEFTFDSITEYNDYIISNKIRSLNGDAVRSHGELIIANCLFKNRVHYDYEARYPYKTYGQSDKRTYQPDFTVTMPTKNGNYKIYIEYFGINREMETAKYIDAPSYLEEMQWKQNLHKNNQTILIELFYYELREGDLEQRLTEELVRQGIVLNPLSNEEILEIMNSSGKISKLARLMVPILNHYRSNNYTVEHLFSKSAKIFSGPNKERADSFIKIFQPVCQKYTKFLQERGEIDFDQMVGMATEYVRSGKYSSPFKHILVDEFQDISLARARLVKELKDQVKDSTFFCVGDDWQSIFRFTGSDIYLMTDFESNFGNTAQNVLDETFRFNNKIAELSGTFIMRNDRQIKKQIKPKKNVGVNRVFVSFQGPDRSEEDEVIDLLSRIASKKPNENQTVLVLCRYGLKKKPIDTNLIKRSASSRIKVEYQTAHASKGGEADHVIVRDMSLGLLGFPSGIEDDPLLDLVLPKPESFEHAEERRLFYVVLTRARESVYLITPQGQKSQFISELLSPPDGIHYEVETIGLSRETDLPACPKCSSGHLKEFPGKKEYGSFWGCSNYPFCKYIKNSNKKNHASHEFPKCKAPGCDGRLKKKKGKNGMFLGCTNFRFDRSGCNYTVDLPR